MTGKSCRVGVNDVVDSTTTSDTVAGRHYYEGALLPAKPSRVVAGSAHAKSFDQRQSGVGRTTTK